jgi:hypothetical protein
LCVSLDIRQVFSLGLRDRRATPPQWLDLAKGRLRLDRPAAMAARDFLPLGLPPHAQVRGDLGSPIPRGPRKSRRRHPSLCSGPKLGAAAVAFGREIAIEAAMVADSDS